MTITPINDIRVGILQRDGSATQSPVTESPYFKTLRTFDRAIYEEYLDTLQHVSGAPHDEMGFFAFMAMAEEVRRWGFVVGMRPRIRFDADLVCLDGQHRLAILHHFYGPELGLEIVDSEVQSLWVKLNK